MSCAPNLCIRKIVKRGKLEKKKMKKKAHVGARADAAVRGRSQRLRAILVLREAAVVAVRVDGGGSGGQNRSVAGLTD
jgi:hypothetical protein